MRKGLIFGDTHGSLGDLQRIYKMVEGYDFTFSVGDFGYWPRAAAGRKFLDGCADLVQKTGVPMYWVPGNHEDYAAINEDIEFSVRDDQEFVQTHVGVWMVPRSLTWTWGHTNYCAIGGAFSIDRDSRVKGAGEYGWFDDEIPKWSDLDRIGTSCRVMITHDAPVNVAHQLGWRNLDPWGKGANIYRVIQAGIRIAEPNVLVHGHWHRRLDYKLKVDNRTIQCYGLSYTHQEINQSLATMIDGRITPITEADVIHNWETYR